MKEITLVIPADPLKNLNFAGELNINKEKCNVIIVRGKNPSKNRNIGIAKAKTEFVAFINAHTVISSNWTDKVLEFFEEHKEIDIVGGPQLNYEKDNFFAKSSGFALSSIFGTAQIKRRYSQNKLNLNADETYLTSANLICRKRVFDKVKFDESIYPGEDPKFISDAKKEGYKVAYSPEIVVYNKRREGFFSLAKQIFYYGRTRPQKEPLKETLKKPFFLIPSIFVLYLLSLPLVLYLGKLYFLPLIIYIILNLLFSLYEGIKNRGFFSIFILPFVFLTIHLSYGLGFLTSLVYHRK